jgi:hypothetical protein
MNIVLPQCPGRLPALPQQASAGQRCVLRCAHRRCWCQDIAQTSFINDDATACVSIRILRTAHIGVLARMAQPQSP